MSANRRPGRALQSRAVRPVVQAGAQPAGIPGVAILPLRAFLGITFLYAGLQKLTDPGFFRPGSSTYIGAQLLAYSRGSPIRFVLLHMMEHALFFGVLTVIAELTIGVLVLTGFLTRGAAIAGLGLNFIFFLSASWHTYPYFFGSDIVFVACWLTLALTGPGPYALDSLVYTHVEDQVGQGLTPLVAGPVYGGVRDAADLPRRSQPGAIARRDAIVGGLATAALLVLGLLPRSSSTGTPVSGSASAGGSSSATGEKVGTVKELAANGALTGTVPGNGDPAIVVAVNQHYYAYDAVCTHAGCTVQWDPQYKLLVCPCHGGAYDPTHNAAVVQGPPPAPLTAVPFKIDSNGNIYLT